MKTEIVLSGVGGQGLISTGEILGVTSPLKFAIACVVAVWLVLRITSCRA